MSGHPNRLDVASVIERLREMRQAADRAEFYVVGYRHDPDDVALLYLASGEGARLLFEGSAINGLCTKITRNYKKRWFVQNRSATSSARPRLLVQSPINSLSCLSQVPPSFLVILRPTL